MFDRIALKSSQHWVGSEYAKISMPQYQINTEFLSGYNFKADESVLDIGCGEGAITREIAKKVHHGQVIGIDASENMIQTANTVERLPHLNFYLLNAQDIKFKQKFDTVVCFFCMQWVPNKQLTFEKIYHSLKNSGHFLMIVPLPHPHLPNIRLTLCSLPQWQAYFENYIDPLSYVSDSNYKAYSDNAGFKEKLYSINETKIEFPDYKTFL